MAQMKESNMFVFSFQLQAKEPKAVIKVDTINATFQPEKIGHPNGLQITYLRDFSTRNIFVYHENGKVLHHKCPKACLSEPLPSKKNILYRN